jgi:hypothetical protein
MTPLLHVTNGDIVQELLLAAGVEGTVSVWADPLWDGPLVPLEPTERFREVRARFLSGLPGTPEGDALPRLTEWDRAFERAGEFEEVVLWFEHDLFDQFLLLRHLAWWRTQDPKPVRLSLICIDRFPGVEPFHGLGQLAPADLRDLLPTRRPVTEAELNAGAAVWAALVASDPRELERLRLGGVPELPHVAPALRRFVEEYPAVRTGLSRTETLLLEELTGGARSPAELFRAVQKREERVFMGDTSFWDRVLGLARGPAPLITLDLEPTGDGVLPGGRVRRLAAGEAVLAGHEDWVRVAGVDRWHGGVRLTGRAVPWRWDPDTTRLTATAA